MEVDRGHGQDQAEDRFRMPGRVAGGEDAALANAEKSDFLRAAGSADGGDGVAQMVFRIIGEVAELIGPVRVAPVDNK
jgi:hypothetical protein